MTRAQVWAPTDWATVDHLNKIAIVEAVADGRCYPIPDPDNQGCIVWVYDWKEGDEFYGSEQDPTSCHFLDEVLELWHDGLIEFQPGNHPVITATGEEWLAVELAATAAAALPERARDEALKAIRWVDQIGCIDQAQTDLPRFAEALRGLALENCLVDVSHEAMLTAVPALIADALAGDEEG